MAKYRIKVDKTNSIYNPDLGLTKYWYSLEKKKFLVGWLHVTGEYLVSCEEYIKKYFMDYLKRLPDEKKVIDTFKM